MTVGLIFDALGTDSRDNIIAANLFMPTHITGLNLCR